MNVKSEEGGGVIKAILFFPSYLGADFLELEFCHGHVALVLQPHDFLPWYKTSRSFGTESGGARVVGGGTSVAFPSSDTMDRASQSRGRNDSTLTVFYVRDQEWLASKILNILHAVALKVARH